MQHGTPQSIESAAVSGKDDAASVADGMGSAAEDRSKQRRAHRKSRFGCKTCKKRRIKCDERKPECSNCTSRQVRCDYATGLARTPDHEPVRSHSKASTASSASLGMADLELMYHWTTSTCHTLSTTYASNMYWKHEVTEVGLANEYVLKLVLATAALHLAYLRPNRREEYTKLANAHYSAALPVLTAEISQLAGANIDAVLLGERMLNFVVWAHGPRPGEYLAFGDGGRSEWLTLFRGIRTTVEALGDTARVKLQGPTMTGKNRPLPAREPPFEYKQPLTALRDYVTYNSSPSSLATNIQSIDLLYDCYHNRYEGVDSEYHMAFAWLYKMKDDFVEALQRHETVEMAIYAHFVVLLWELERFWYMKGWTSHVLGAIWDILRDEDRVHIRWPCSIVGWVAPN